MREHTGLKHRFSRESLKWTDNRERAYGFDYDDAEVIAAASRGEFSIEPKDGPEGCWLVTVGPDCYLAEDITATAVMKLGERLLTIWVLAVGNDMSDEFDGAVHMSSIGNETDMLKERLAVLWRAS